MEKYVKGEMAQTVIGKLEKMKLIPKTLLSFCFGFARGVLLSSVRFTKYRVKASDFSRLLRKM